MSEALPTLPAAANAVAALTFMREITKAIGAGFHPDTPGADYVNIETNTDSFTHEQAAQLDADLSQAFVLLEAAGRDP